MQHIEDENKNAVSLTKIARLMTEAGLEAYVEMTGGGCATIYAGTAKPLATDTVNPYTGTLDPRYAVVVGPGGYDGVENYASLLEFSYAYDDDAPSHCQYATEGTEEDLAAKIVEFARANPNYVSDRLPIATKPVK